MHRTERAELTVLCLLTDGDRLLLQNRVRQDWQGYALPGGHVEPGESFVDAVVREMREETGLTVLHPRLAGLKQFPIENGRYIVFLFRAEAYTGTLRSSEEGAVEWVDRRRLSDLQTVADLDALLDVIENPDRTEFQYLVDGDIWTVCVK